MNICITSQGDSMDSSVDPRFGRCSYFNFIDTETFDFEAVENPYTKLSGGAGVQAGQFMSSKGIKVVLTGDVGPNAFETLSKAGIEIFTGISGTVREALESYREGRIKASEKPSVNSKFGMKER